MNPFKALELLPNTFRHTTYTFRQQPYNHCAGLDMDACPLLPHKWDFFKGQVKDRTFYLTESTSSLIKTLIKTSREAQKFKNYSDFILFGVNGD